MAKTKIIYTTLGVALTATTTAAIAVPIAIKNIATKKTTDLLSKMIPLGGPSNSLAERLQDSTYKPEGKLRYVAIGDSVTAGYNGYMNSNEAILKEPTKPVLADNADAAAIAAYKAALVKYDADMKDYQSKTYKDYLSYADFIASDLEKAGMLYDYRNFSVTGDTIPQAKQVLFRNTSALSAMRKADVISVSIGANDLLAAVEVLKLSFNGIRGEADTDKVVQFNAARDAIDRITRINATPAPGEAAETTGSPSGYPNETYTKHAIRDSFDQLVEALKRGDLAGVLDVEQDLLSKLFDLIELDMATFISEVHQAAPQAKIVVMGYAFPFHLLPSTLIDRPIPDMDKGTADKPNPNYGKPKTIDGKVVTIKDVFAHLIDTLNDAVSRANYIKFFDINSLKEFSKESDQVSYTLVADADAEAEKVTRPEWDRVMPNPLDIHPSTYGHQVIAGHLYEWMLGDMRKDALPYQSIQKQAQLKLTDEQVHALEAIYTYAGVDSEFPIKDEYASYDSSMMKMILRGLDNAPVLKALGQVLSTYANGNALGEAFSQIQKYINNDSLTKEDVLKVLEIIPNIRQAIDDAKFNAQWSSLEATFKDSTKSMTEKLTAFANKLPSIMKLDAGVTVPAGLALPSKFETWKELKDTIDYLAFIVKNIKAPTLVFGNTGHSTSDFLERIKTLIDAVDPVDFQKDSNGDPVLDPSTFTPVSVFVPDMPIKSAFMQILSDQIVKGVDEAHPTNNLNGIKLVQTLLGTVIYLGNNNIDKTHDDFYQVIKAIGGLFLGGIDWNSDTIKDMLPMLGSIVAGGYDYDETETALHVIHDDQKIRYYEREDNGFVKIEKHEQDLMPKLTITDPDTNQEVEVFDFYDEKGNEQLAVIANDKIVKLLPYDASKITTHTDIQVAQYVVAPYKSKDNDDYTGVDKFIDHIFAQSKIAGFDIDSIRSKMPSGEYFMKHLAQGEGTPEGKSLVQQWVEGITK